MAPLKVMCVGHSIVKGESTPGGWRWPLQKILRFHGSDYGFDFVGPQTTNSTGMDDPQHAGYDSNTFDDQNGLIGGWMSTYAPDIVLVMLGINDLLGGASAATVDGKLGTFLTNLYAVNASCHVYVLAVVGVFSPYAGLGGVPGDIATRVADCNTLYSARCTAQTGAGKFCVYVPFGYGLGMVSGDTIDGIHPTGDFYCDIAARIARFMLLGESSLRTTGVAGEVMLWTYGATPALMRQAKQLGFSSVITPARIFDPAADEWLLDQADSIGVGIVFNVHSVVDNYDNGDVDWVTPFAAWLDRVKLKVRSVAIITYDEPEDGPAQRRANIIDVCTAIYNHSPLPTLGVFSSYIFESGVYASWGGYHRFEATGVYPAWEGMDCNSTPEGVAGYIGSGGSSIVSRLWTMIAAGGRSYHVVGCFGILGGFDDATCGDVNTVAMAEEILFGNGTYPTGLLERLDGNALRYRGQMWWTWAPPATHQSRFIGLSATPSKYAELARVNCRARNAVGVHPFTRTLKRGESCTFTNTGGSATWSLIGAPAGVSVAGGVVTVAENASPGAFKVRATVGGSYAEATCMVVAYT